MAILNKHHGNIPADAVYIGRGSQWGNPFVIGRDGDRAKVVHLYELWLRERLDEGTISASDLAALHGKDLVCFCAPAACHGDVLARYAQIAAAPKPEEELPIFRLIVAGGRTFTDYTRVHDELFALASNSLAEYQVVIVSGMARGADKTAWQVAKDHEIECVEFPADWDSYGKRAGFLRNEQMGDYADGLLAFWDGQSRGTAHMIKYTKSLGKPVRIVRY